MEDDYWSNWFRGRWPFFRGFRDVDEIMGKMLETMESEFQEFSKRAPKDLIRERTLPDGSKVRELGPFVYGYSVKIGSDGKPHVREFGNIKPRTRLGKPQINVIEKREPLADVMTTDGEVKVVVELPGVGKDDVQLHGLEDKLTISVDTPQRKYYKEVKLPMKVNMKETKASFKNGVLEISLPKQEKLKPKGEMINIE